MKKANGKETSLNSTRSSSVKRKIDAEFVKMLVREHRLYGIRRLVFADFEVEFTEELPAVVEQPVTVEIPEDRPIGGPLGLGRYEALIAEEQELTPETMRFPGPTK